MSNAQQVGAKPTWRWFHGVAHGAAAAAGAAAGQKAGVQAAGAPAGGACFGAAAGPPHRFRAAAEGAPPRPPALQERIAHAVKPAHNLSSPFLFQNTILTNICGREPQYGTGQHRKHAIRPDRGANSLDSMADNTSIVIMLVRLCSW